MTPSNADREIEKLREACHDHANRITDHEGRLVHLEKDMAKVEDLSHQHSVALARGQKVMEQMGKTSDVMRSTVDTMNDTVHTMNTTMSIFGKFLKFGVLPIAVALSGNALWTLFTK